MSNKEKLWTVLRVFSLLLAFAVHPSQALADGAGSAGEYYWCSGTDLGQVVSSELDMVETCVWNTLINWDSYMTVQSKSCAGTWKNYPTQLMDEDDGYCQLFLAGVAPDGTYQTRQYGVAISRCERAPSTKWAGDRPRHCVPLLSILKDKTRTCPYQDPIFPLTGINENTQDLAMTLAGRPLSVTYDQRNAIPTTDNSTSNLLAGPAGFGTYWTANVAKRLVAQAAPSAGVRNLALERGGGRWETFQLNISSSRFISTVEPLDIFQAQDSNWLRTDGGGLLEEIYASNGNLLATYFANGGSLTYAYENGLLSSIKDQNNRSVTFSYGSASGLIETIAAPDGAEVQIAYDGSGKLTTLRWPDSSSKKFLYQGSLLTNIVDENHSVDDGVYFESFTYDVNSRVTSAQNSDGIDRYSIAYGSPPAWKNTDEYDPTLNVVWRTTSWEPPSPVDLTMPNGRQTTITAADVLGSPAQVAQTHVSGAGCSAATSSQTYSDGAGNLTSQDDFNGNRVCFAYDTARNLRTVTLEGLMGGASGKACPGNLATYAPSASDAAHPERKTTTIWHPDWALKAQEAEPKKITTWVYNGQPDPIAGGTAACAPTAPALPDGKPIAVLCARYEQATTDATGALGLSAAVSGPARAWTYTYNQFGEVLTESTPKLSPTDSLSHTTTYTYFSDTSMNASVGHTIGDLQSVTNPLGQVTNYTSYDGAGRLLSSTDPNGVVTTQTYWPRGWLKSQTVAPPGSAAPQVTAYDYWPTGLLKTVTMADASTLNYGYDDAHRLTDISDSAGNKIHYVLDNSGNRTSEQVSDASGNLASTVTRVFDALNRVQSQTGLAH